MNIDIEVWKDILCYEEEYQISNYGNVRSLPRIIKRSNGRPLKIKGKILKQNITKHGFNTVNLKGGKLKQTHPVHYLVAKTFIPNPKNYKYILHKDTNYMNNYADNLEWVSYGDKKLFDYIETNAKQWNINSINP